MHAIQVEHEQVFEGIMHGFMHKGQVDECHQHSPRDVLYISTSDRAADFEVKGILRKPTIPNNFYASGYANTIAKLRGRTIEGLAVILSPEILHVEPDLFCDSMAELIEYPGVARPKWIENSTLITFGPSNGLMLGKIRERLYDNYLNRNPMFTRGSSQLKSNITFAELLKVVDEAGKTAASPKKLEGQYFFGAEFCDYNQQELYRHLLTFNTCIMPGDNMVFHPLALMAMYNEVLSPLKLTNVKL